MSRWRLALVLAALAAACIPEASAKDDSSSPEAALLRWVGANGGKAVMELGKPCPTCPRGVTATHAAAAGDALAWLPLNLTMSFDITPSHHHGGTGSEYHWEVAADLLELMHSNGTWNTSYLPWWQSLPAQGDMVALDMLTDEEAAMLQLPKWEYMRHDSLKRAARRFSDLLRERPALQGRVSLDTFLFTATAVVTRAIYNEGKTWLMPLVDMLNHAPEPAANVHWAIQERDGVEGVVVVALADIKEGDELLLYYGSELLHRPDNCFLDYGFTEPPRDPPLLCSEDVATEALQHEPVDVLSGAEDAPGLRAELARLQQQLWGLPTTLEKDQALLEVEPEENWRVRAILYLRIQRKQALRQRIAFLKALLEELEGKEGHDSAEL